MTPGLSAPASGGSAEEPAGTQRQQKWRKSCLRSLPGHRNDNHGGVSDITRADKQLHGERKRVFDDTDTPASCSLGCIPGPGRTGLLRSSQGRGVAESRGSTVRHRLPVEPLLDTPKQPRDYRRACNRRLEENLFTPSKLRLFAFSPFRLFAFSPFRLFRLFRLGRAMLAKFCRTSPKGN